MFVFKIEQSNICFENFLLTTPKNIKVKAIVFESYIQL